MVVRVLLVLVVVRTYVVVVVVVCLLGPPLNPPECSSSLFGPSLVLGHHLGPSGRGHFDLEAALGLLQGMCGSWQRPRASASKALHLPCHGAERATRAVRWLAVLRALAPELPSSPVHGRQCLPLAPIQPRKPPGGLPLQPDIPLAMEALSVRRS